MHLLIIVITTIRDEETLSAILVSNHYHVENTIETVLSMSDQQETPTQAPSDSASQKPSE